MYCGYDWSPTQTVALTAVKQLLVDHAAASGQAMDVASVQ